MPVPTAVIIVRISLFWEDLVQTRLFDVNQLAANWKNRLKFPVTPLFGGTTGRIALDDEQFGVGRIAVGTVGEFAGQPATRKRAFAHRLAGFAGSLARTGGQQSLLDDLLGRAGIRVEVRHQTVIDNGRHDAVDFRVHQLDLRLRLETRVRQLHAQHANQAFANIVTGNRRVFFLQQIVLLGVLVDGAGQCGAEAGKMRAAVGDWEWSWQSRESGRCSCRCIASHNPQTRLRPCRQFCSRVCPRR